jgi:hypothetical protein
MMYFWWVVVGLLASALVSRLVRGMGAISIVDVGAGTVAGILGGALGREVIFRDAFTNHYIAVLLIDVICAEITVALCVWMGFGRMAPIRTELGIGPLADTEQIRRAEKDEQTTQLAA